MDAFSFEFFEEICLRREAELQYHAARKTIPYFERGKTVVPPAPNGIKLEKFLFDAFQFATKIAAFEVDRVAEFAPLKNATGPDSPLFCSVMVSNLYQRLAKRYCPPACFRSDFAPEELSALCPSLSISRVSRKLLLARTEQVAFLDQEERGLPKNKIHSATGASEFGYKSALVGGVTVISWTIPAILQVFGDAWASEGWLDLQLLRPVFPGDVMRTALYLTPTWEVELAMTNQTNHVCLAGSVGMGLPTFLTEMTIPNLHKSVLNKVDLPQKVDHKFDDIPQKIDHKFDDIPQKIDHKFDDVPQKISHKFDDIPQKISHKFDDIPQKKINPGNYDFGLNLDPSQFPAARRLTTQEIGGLLGKCLLPRVDVVSREKAQWYAEQFARDTRSLWVSSTPFLHPGWLAGRMTNALEHSMAHLPAIHTRTRLKNWGPRLSSSPEKILTAVKIKRSFEKKGNHYAVLDGVIENQAGRIIAQIEHTTIFQIRKPNSTPQSNL